jgi:tetratricopeptide (TPR) repeat protein
MRRNAVVAGVLLGVLLSACAHHKTTADVAAAPQAAPAPVAAAVEPPEPALQPQPMPSIVPPPTPVAAPPSPPPVIDPTLDQAASLATNNQPDQARRVYLALLNQANVSRQTIAEAARGLYRLGAFADAVEAFRNLGIFNRGEEDLRYYNAVSLFETGHYDDAKKELACALPYIQVTADVARYRDKIQKMGSPQAMK